MKKKSLLTLNFIFLLLMSWTMLSAQDEDNKAKFDIGADLMSRYVWRGADYGNAPSIQPTMSFSCKGLEIGAWGAFALSNTNYQEVDLYVNYSFCDYFALGFTDYFFPDYTIPNNHYFNYQKDSTGHILEGSATFTASKKVPISLLVAVNFYGADAKKANGDPFYSTYLELSYPFSCKGLDFNVFVGGTPNKADTDKGESGFYSNDPGIVNLGLTISKAIPITEKYSLPLSASLITNPQAENIFFVFGISF
jgi:hypothetical protein